MPNLKVFQFCLILSIGAVSTATKPILCVNTTADFNTCNSATYTDCVMGSDWRDCVYKIQNDIADITLLTGKELYEAGKCLQMKPIITEVNNLAANTKYYAVAVGKKVSAVTMNNLKGKKSCHTGLGKTAGWVVPMSILFVNKIDQVGQASAFFNESCVPGAEANSNLCKLCTPNCARGSSNDFYGYSGAADCLANTNADVAFVKQQTFLDRSDKNDFKLLCKNGSTANIDEYLSCNLGRVPSNALVAKSTITTSEIDTILTEIDKDIAIFKPMLFSNIATGFCKVAVGYDAFLGSDFVQALPEVTCSSSP